MKPELTDRVPGLTDEDVAAVSDEAAAGYDLGGIPLEPNPHQGSVPVIVPDELRQAVEDRARRDGQSPEDVVREALTAYLHIA